MDSSNLQPTPGSRTPNNFILRISGVDRPTLSRCPERDSDAVTACAVIMICSWLYQAGLFSIITHRLFALEGQIRPDFILLSMFLATFIMQIDSYSIMRSSWYLAGIAQLKLGGIDISGGFGARVKASIFLVIRILLSIGLAQLTAIFVGILVFSSDIAPKIEGRYAQDNANLIAEATVQVDVQIKRATDALNAESAREAALASQVSALRQNQIDPSANRPEIQQANEELAQLSSEKIKADEALKKAEAFASDELAGIRGSQENSGIPGDGPRRRAAMEALENARDDANRLSVAIDAARSRVDALRTQSIPSNEATKRQSQNELPRFEANLASEDAKLEALREDVGQMTAHRDNAIRSAVEAAPNHIRAEDGLLSQISILEHVAQADRKIAVVIILIDLTSFGFELAAVLAKILSFVPTTYAALLVRDSYMSFVRIADDMMVELNRGTSEADPDVDIITPTMQPDNTGRDMGVEPLGTSTDPLASPAKRPRGRPPKTSFSDKNPSPFPFPNGFTPNDP